MDIMIAVVIPCFRVKAQVLSVLEKIGSSVSQIYVIDDRCPENTGKHVQTVCRDPRVRVYFLEKNRGVGGATLFGFVLAANAGASIVVKVDGDGQNDPALIDLLTRPILLGETDYAKGNRFFCTSYLRGMPLIRKLGNSVLSFLSKISSGYWRIMDPTNGFVALHTSLLRLIPIGEIHQRFFFESHLLYHLNLIRAKVTDIPIRAKYAEEKSNLKIRHAIFLFSFLHIVCFAKRIFYSYFVRDFNIGSVQLFCGIGLIVSGLSFGGWRWWISSHFGIIATSGTVTLAALPIILGLQLVLSALNYDILTEPSVSLHPYLDRHKQRTKLVKQHPQDLTI